MSSGPKSINKEPSIFNRTDLPIEPRTIDEPKTYEHGNTYPRQKVIAIDVDETLIIKGKLNRPLLEWCAKQKAKGFTLILWSARGKENAEKAEKMSGLKFDIVMSKPGHIVDDIGWGWVRYTQEINF